LGGDKGPGAAKELTRTPENEAKRGRTRGQRKLKEDKKPEATKEQ
jgi:hypothetical protein